MPGPAPCLRAGVGLLPQARQAGHMLYKRYRTTGPTQHRWGDQLGPDLSGWMDNDGWVVGWMDWWVSELEGWIDEIGRSMDGQTDGWTSDWMEGWTHG